jgi:hypothetical protein
MYATVGIFELIKIAAIEVGFVSAATDSSHCCFMFFFSLHNSCFGALVVIGI